MHTYKLYYFNVRGRAEAIRLMFHFSGIPFEDHRVPAEDWPLLKPKMPNGQMPVLEVDGKDKLSQSVAIARYVAKQAHLYGADDYEAALIDSYVDLAGDLGQKMKQVIAARFQKNDALVKEEWAKIRDDIVKSLKVYEEALAHNKEGVLVGHKVSLADFWVAENMDKLHTLDPTVLDTLPHIKGLIEKVYHLPHVKEYIEKRPEGM